MFMSLKALVPILYVPRHDADKKKYSHGLFASSVLMWFIVSDERMVKLKRLVC